MRRALSAILLATAALLGTSQVFAATDGSVGAVSNGSLDISLTIPQLVRISYFDDIDLGTFDGANGMVGRDDLCVWSTTRGYKIMATGDGDAGAFVLLGNSNADELAYAVQWADSAGQSSGTALSENVFTGSQATAVTSPTCQGGASLNASVVVTVADSDMAAVSADTYSGTLSLLVEPE